jgi:hypothetical protein
MDNQKINQLAKFWILSHRLVTPFKILFGYFDSNDKDGGDIYEERCTIGGTSRKNKNDN